jgi:hypothetical protein
MRRRSRIAIPAAVALAGALALAPAAAAQQPPAPPPVPPAAPAIPAAPGVPGIAPRLTASDTARLAAAVHERYAVPEVPAVTFLDASAANIARPATPKDFLVTLANGVDADGRARQGFALEASPFAIFPGFQVTLADYRRSRLRYALANLLLSVATVQTTGDTASTDLAAAARTTLLDRGDPMRDTSFLRAYGDAMLACAPPLPPAAIPFPGEPDTMAPARQALLAARAAEQRACLAERPGEMARAYVRGHWNAARVSVALAYGERLPGSRLADRTTTGHRLWAVAGVPLGTVAQGVGYVDWSRTRARDDRPAYGAVTYGARVNVGSARINGFYELLAREVDGAPPGVRRHQGAWSGGVEFLAVSDVWISTGFGERFDERAGPDRVVVLANVRWGISTKPWLRTE